MDVTTPDSVAYFTAGIIVATLLVTGPLVGWADVTPDAGWADVTVESTPDEASVRAIPDNETRMAFDVPPATVSATDVTGSPVLAYKVHIPELKFYTTGITFLSEDGEVTIDTPETTIPAEQVTENSYEGTVTLELRAGERTETLYEGTVTVRVER